MLLGFLFTRIVFRLFLINLYKERTWKRASSFHIEKGFEDFEAGQGAEISSVCSRGFERSVRSRGWT